MKEKKIATQSEALLAMTAQEIPGRRVSAARGAAIDSQAISYNAKPPEPCKITSGRLLNVQEISP